jgi:RinA family phage transcriptional activator
MKKELRAYIEAELRDYHKTLSDIANLRDDLLNESPSPPDGMPRGSTTSDPTFKRATRLITCRRLEVMCRTVEGIAAALDRLPPEKIKLVELKYWVNPQTLTDIGIAQKLDCGQNTYYRWRNELCRDIARELGMLERW